MASGSCPLAIFPLIDLPVIQRFGRGLPSLFTFFGFIGTGAADAGRPGGLSAS